MEVSKELRVKKEPIFQTREATMRSNYDQSVKHESQSIQIIDRKLTREDISSDNQPNKRKRQSMKVKEEVEVKAEEFSNKRSIQSVSIAFLKEETTSSTDDYNPIANIYQPKNRRKNKSK